MNTAANVVNCIRRMLGSIRVRLLLFVVVALAVSLMLAGLNIHVVAGGIMDTHSRTADCRAEILAAHAAMAGAGAKTVREIMSSVTTTAALEVIEAAGVGDVARASLAAAIEDRLRRRAAGACDIAAVVFDAERRELFRTSGADAVIGKLGATYE